ncbi:MAG: phage tail tube protein [Clostridiales bacterium]|nr:phage tail tube protein [Clostridiales bacterium]
MPSTRKKMRGKDAVFASLADFYVTLNGNRYNVMQAINFESRLAINNREVPVLGFTILQHKAGVSKGTWSATVYYNTSIFRAWLLHFKDTGELIPFECEAVNEDPSSDAGSQKITHTGCLIDNATLAKMIAGEDILTEDLSGTFDDWDMPQEFDLLPGMTSTP